MPSKCDYQNNRLVTRRAAVQAGAIGLGLGIGELAAVRALPAASPAPRAKSVIFVFLTGGLAHHDSFDPKPEAPSDIRGEFQPRATKVPGVQLCEHLPLLADRADRFALVRSMRTG